jgi:polysaccharide biosynthesis transport protein
MNAVPAPVCAVDPIEIRFAEASLEVARPKDAALARAVEPGSALVETFRVLRAKLEAIDASRELRNIGVVAAGPGEGASFAAIGLAAALARDGARRVLLVEAGLRRPALEGRLQLASAAGLSDWLEGETRGPVPLRRIEPLGFCLLAGGTPRPEPAPLLESSSLARLLRAARGDFDFVVLDCPPLSRFADAVLIQDLVDGFVLVVRSRLTPGPQIQRAVSQLKPDRVRGVILNDLREIFARALPRGLTDRR